MTTPIQGSAPAEVMISPRIYLYMQRYIYERSGIVLDSNKHYLLESRLAPILRELKLETLDELCHKLRAERKKDLSQQIVDAMTTNETLFFRDRTMFDALRSRILPSLLERRGNRRKLRIWSAASSSGQEAYSLAMMLVEMNVEPAEVEILGTDISEKMLARARDGGYVQFEISRGLPQAYLGRYFVHAGLDWVVSDELRKMVGFERFDLRGDMKAFGLFDLMLCRNVLIYFDHETKDSIFNSIRRSLQPGGVLLLGATEVMNVPRGFVRRQVNQTSYYCVNRT